MQSFISCVHGRLRERELIGFTDNSRFLSRIQTRRYDLVLGLSFVVGLSLIQVEEILGDVHTKICRFVLNNNAVHRYLLFSEECPFKVTMQMHQKYSTKLFNNGNSPESIFKTAHYKERYFIDRRALLLIIAMRKVNLEAGLTMAVIHFLTLAWEKFVFSFYFQGIKTFGQLTSLRIVERG